MTPVKKLFLIVLAAHGALLAALTLSQVSAAKPKPPTKIVFVKEPPQAPLARVEELKPQAPPEKKAEPPPLPQQEKVVQKAEPPPQPKQEKVVQKAQSPSQQKQEKVAQKAESPPQPEKIVQKASPPKKKAEPPPPAAKPVQKKEKAIAKKNKPAAKPAAKSSKPPPAPSREKEELIALMGQSLGKIDKSLKTQSKPKAIPSKGSSSSSKAISLASESIVVVGAGVDYASELSRFLKSALTLPEAGDVSISISLSSSGLVENLQVKSSPSAKNRSYLEKRLPALRFPLPPDSKAVTFHLTLKGDF